MRRPTVYNYFSLPLLVIIDAPTKHIWLIYMKKDAKGISLVLISKVFEKKILDLYFYTKPFMSFIHLFSNLHNYANSKRVFYQSVFFSKFINSKAEFSMHQKDYGPPQVKCWLLISSFFMQWISDIFQKCYKLNSSISKTCRKFIA